MAERPPLLGLSPLRALWVVTWPMVAIGVLKTTYFLTDSAFIGRLGDQALAAAGGSAFAWWILLLLGELAGTGAHSLVARAEGARDVDAVPRIGGQAVWDGRDYTGRRPASGVYLVWASATQSFDSPEAVVAKIALLR